MLDLSFCARAFSSCGKGGPLLIAVRGPLTVAASLVGEHRLQTRRLQTRRLSSCGSRAQLLRGMWDPPRPGLEPVSPALAGGLPTTAPPGKPQEFLTSALVFIFIFQNGNWRTGRDKMSIRYSLNLIMFRFNFIYKKFRPKKSGKKVY